MLADGERPFREHLRSRLIERGFEVAAVAATAAEAVSLAANIKPDVILLGSGLPGAGDVDAIRRITAASGDTRVVVLTDSAGQQDLIDAIQAGACGYLLRDSSMDEIANGVETADTGGSLLASRIATGLFDRVRSSAPAPNPDRSPPSLSPREVEVLKLITAGKRNTEIAAELVISERTVEHHVSSLLAKLGVENRVQAAVYAVREQLFEL